MSWTLFKSASLGFSKRQIFSWINVICNQILPISPLKSDNMTTSSPDDFSELNLHSVQCPCGNFKVATH